MNGGKLGKGERAKQYPKSVYSLSYHENPMPALRFSFTRHFHGVLNHLLGARFNCPRLLARVTEASTKPDGRKGGKREGWRG